MLRERSPFEVSEFLRYLAVHPAAEGSLPPLSQLSRELGISVAGLREQLEVARAMGLVDVRELGHVACRLPSSRRLARPWPTLLHSAMSTFNRFRTFGITSRRPTGMKQQASSFQRTRKSYEILLPQPGPNWLVHLSKCRTRSIGICICLSTAA